MQSKLDRHTKILKSNLNKNFLSPLFIRLANLLYANEQYEECISVCKTGLEIYPDYLTSKLILLKAYLKAEYLNEAEILFKEIKSKITNEDMLSKLNSNIRNLKAMSTQGKIYYSKVQKSKFDFKSFDKKFHLQENLFSEFTLNEFVDDKCSINSNNEKEFQNFLELFEAFHFESAGTKPAGQPEHPAGHLMGDLNSDDLLNKIKIVTETLADIYAQQKNYKDAFDAYNVLLRAGSPNSKRIEEKIYELERNMIKND